MVVVVAGSTRSGTSLLMKLLDAGGVAVAGQWPAYEEYPLGTTPWNELDGKAVKLVDAHRHFPPADLVHDLWVIQTRRISKREQTKSFLNVWQTMVGGVAKCDKSTKAGFQDSFYDSDAQISKWARKQQKHTVISFEAVLRDPARVCRKLCGFLERKMDVDSMAKQVEARTAKASKVLRELDWV